MKHMATPSAKAISNSDRSKANEGAGLAVASFRGIVRQFLKSGEITAETAGKFRAAISKSIKLRKRPGGLGHV